MSAGGIERCGEHGLVAGQDGLCAICRGNARTSVNRRVLGGLLAVTVFGGMASAGAWVWMDRHSRDRDLMAAVGKATAIHPWIELPVLDQVDTGTAPGAGMQGTRRFHFPQAEAVQASAWPPPASLAPQAGAANAQGAQVDRNKRIREAMQTVSVKLYVADWCPACQDAKRWMREHEIHYDEQNIETGESARAELRRINPRRSIPTFEIDGAVLVGFSGGNVESAIRRAAEARVRKQDGS